ncbi:MAG: hypothetical protein INH41_01240 [Myxococcaceae bacterium]|jgi:hypothetical protein|nr:hypothetical protein [Myxococcaceae bacterium]MCA3011002.1 hypothetical protein [Myxococcaceae bacterium]
MPRLLVASLVVLSSCAFVHDGASAPVPGRSVVIEPRDCKVEVVRGPSPPGQAVTARRLEGSVFLAAAEAERLIRREACAAGADLNHVTTGAYGLPSFGTQAVATLLRAAR